MDLAALGFDILKVIGGVGITAISYYTVRGIAPLKPNGQNKCKEHENLMKLTVESNTILKNIEKTSTEQRKIAREERKTLFDKVDKLENDVNHINVKFAYNSGVKSSSKVKASKLLSPFSCIVIDDLTADASCKTLEAYFRDIICCTPANSAEEALEALKNQQYDLCFIDYYLNSDENGYDVYKLFQQAYPKMKCFIYSGQSPESISPNIKDIYVSKPFDRKELIEKINRVLGENN